MQQVGLAGKIPSGENNNSNNSNSNNHHHIYWATCFLWINSFNPPNSFQGGPYYHYSPFTDEEPCRWCCSLPTRVVSYFVLSMYLFGSDIHLSQHRPNTFLKIDAIPSPGRGLHWFNNISIPCQWFVQEFRPKMLSPWPGLATGTGLGKGRWPPFRLKRLAEHS